jgi:hypothetical protein
MVITNNSPSSGFVSWSDLHVQFDGATYLIVDGNTDKIYSYWTPNTPNVLVCTNDFPTLAENEGLVLLNRTGVATVVPNATAIDGDLIVPGTITTKHLAAHSITADQMAVGSVNADSIQAKAITGDKIDAGTITADKLFIADRTNFAQFNPDSLPGENVVETVDGLNYFKMGPESYASLTYAISKVVDFSPGDEFSIKFTGFADAAITLLRPD